MAGSWVDEEGQGSLPLLFGSNSDVGSTRAKERRRLVVTVGKIVKLSVTATLLLVGSPPPAPRGQWVQRTHLGH